MKKILTLITLTITFFVAGNNVEAIGKYKCEVTGSPLCITEISACQTGWATKPECDGFLENSVDSNCTIERVCYDSTDQTDPNHPNPAAPKYRFTYTGDLGPMFNSPYCSEATCESVRSSCASKADCEPSPACEPYQTTLACRTLASQSGGGDPPVEPEIYTPPESYDITESINNPIASTSVVDLLTKLKNAFIAIAIPILVLAVVYSGFIFVTAQGNEEKLKTAKRNALYAAIGIVIVMSANVLIAVVRNLLSIFS